jgi:transmembrane protein 222
MQSSDQAISSPEEGTIMDVSLPQRKKRNQEDLSFTILWSPLHPITALIPFIGHTGIGNSHGIASDFRGPYYVGDDGRMAFGSPTRALKIDIGQLVGGADRWDEAIQGMYQSNDEMKISLAC